MASKAAECGDGKQSCHGAGGNISGISTLVFWTKFLLQQHHFSTSCKNLPYPFYENVVSASLFKISI